MQKLQLAHRSSVKQHHYKGQKKPIPPMIASNCGPSYELICKSANSVQTALEKDTAWLVSLLKQIEPDESEPEWSGAMVTASKADGSAYGPASNFIFGPLIDMPPSHPDTVLTTLLFFKRMSGRSTLHSFVSRHAIVQSFSVN